MEVLGDLATAAFSDMDFVPIREHDFISPTSENPIRISKVSKPIFNIVEDCRTQSSERTPVPFFRLVRLTVRKTGSSRPWRSLDAAKDEITQVWDALGMEKYQLYLLSQRVRGFHHIPSSQPDKRHYFMNYDHHCVAWTYDVRSAATSGVVIARYHSAYGDSEFDKWFETLCRFESLLRHPLCLLLVSMNRILDWVSTTTDEAQAGVRAVESVSGVHPWCDRELLADGLDLDWLESAGAGLGKLSAASAKAGAIGVKLGYVLLQIQTSQKAATAFNMPFSTTNQSLAQVVNMLEGQFGQHEDKVRYLIERAKTQIPVLYNQMAEKENKSMMVIAVMTMAFLPGTFTATLFAVPSLQWGSTPVIQDNFWIYWAVTIPATAIVFLVWLLCSEGSHLRAFVLSTGGDVAYFLGFRGMTERLSPPLEG